MAQGRIGEKVNEVKKHSIWRSIRQFFTRSKKRTLRFGLLAANVILLAVIATLVLNGSGPHNVTAQNALLSTRNDTAAGALDQLSSTDIAVQIAQAAQMEEVVQVANQADSHSIDLVITSADESVVSKPQLVSTALKSRKDMITYTAVEGDTVSGLASKFGVTSDTIKWSNNLTGNNINAGAQLLISPINGVVYTVKDGDTPDSIARKYRANKDQLITFNDAELTGSFKVGEKIIIPDGVIPAPANNYSRGFAFGLSAIYGYNGYSPGWCTWYAASRVQVPVNWGNATTWDEGARRTAGWTVSKTPRVGAVAQKNGGLGHVGIVEEVSEDGSMIKYSDMNGLAGWGRVGYSDWVPALSRYDWFIYQ